MWWIVLSSECSHVCQYWHESWKSYWLYSYLIPGQCKEFCCSGSKPKFFWPLRLPLTATISCTVTPAKVNCPSNKNKNESYDQPRLRWDRADKVGYYSFTAACFPDILVKLRYFAVSSISLGCDQTVSAFLDAIYDEIVCVLERAASLYVFVHYKNYSKFWWWNGELKLLKEYSVDNDKVWKAAGKPRQGPIFDKRQSSRMRYRQCLRQRQCVETTVCSNELHESLLRKEGAAFWKSWRSKFKSTSKCTVIGRLRTCLPEPVDMGISGAR